MRLMSGCLLETINPFGKTIEYIEAHLNENIGLSDVSKRPLFILPHDASVASVLGESVGHYINRRRL